MENVRHTSIIKRREEDEMKIPLAIEQGNDGQGNIIFNIYSNGERHEISDIDKPYCYSYNTSPFQEVQCIKSDMIPLNNQHSQQPLYKHIFNSRRDYHQYKPEDAMESDVGILRRFLIDHPELVTKYQHNNIKALIIDFEMASRKEYGFVNASRDPIIATGLGFSNLIQSQDTREIYLMNDLSEEKEHIKMICNRIIEYDPDIIVTYNGIDFDFPYLLERMEIYGLDSSILTRDGKPITIKYKKGHDYPDQIQIGGRIHYDIMKRSVKDIKSNKIKDQKLYDLGLKSFSLKPVSIAYKAQNIIQEPPEVMSNLVSIMGTEQLHEYLDSDIRATLHLFHVYIYALIASAERLQVDLKSYIESSPSFAGDILFSRGLNGEGYVSDMTVGSYLEKYYPYIMEKNEEGKYVRSPQGAYVNTPNPGLYREGVIDVDFAALYPNIMITYNLSPETVTLLALEDDIRPFHTEIDKENKHLYLSIPDYSLDKQVIIHIDFSRKGYVAEYLKECIASRKTMKKRMAEIENEESEFWLNDEWITLNINQNDLKVQINSISGYYASKFARWGSIACYMAITGIGRFLLSSLGDWVKTYIEANTDCLYLSEVTVKDLIENYKEN